MAAGNPIGQALVSVSAALTPPGGATLSGNTTVTTNGSGVASFAIWR